SRLRLARAPARRRQRVRHRAHPGRPADAGRGREASVAGPADDDHPGRQRQPDADAEAVGPAGSRTGRAAVEQRRGDAPGRRPRVEAGARHAASDGAGRTGHRREVAGFRLQERRKPPRAGPARLAGMTEFIPPGTRWVDLPSPFPMKRGGALHGARIAYETWGAPNAAGDNSLLIFPGLSPDAHAAAGDANPAAGWWEAMLGPGKPIDTDRWHVVCINPLGSCKGSTGPASVDPQRGEPYRLAFPELSIEDGADAGRAVLRALGIERLACVVGNSMGGMNALAFLARHPGIANAHINISGAARALPFSIAIRSLQREAIRLDRNWNEGNYDEDRYPESGMRMARKLGVITYRSALEWDGRFGRVRLDSDRRDGEDPFGLEFEVESYLEA